MTASTRVKWIISALAVIAIATAGTAFFLLSNPPSPEEAQQILSQEEDAPKVILTEFADFNCRFCAEFALAYYPRLKEDYLNNPNVEFHFRHYPFLDIAFAQHMRQTGPDFSPEGLTQIARISGADIRTFDNCTWQEKHRETVENDLELGRKLRIPGTPTLFTNGQHMEYQSYQNSGIAHAGRHNRPPPDLNTPGLHQLPQHLVEGIAHDHGLLPPHPNLPGYLKPTTLGNPQLPEPPHSPQYPLPGNTHPRHSKTSSKSPLDHRYYLTIPVLGLLQFALQPQANETLGE